MATGYKIEPQKKKKATAPSARSKELTRKADSAKYAKSGKEYTKKYEAYASPQERTRREVKRVAGNVVSRLQNPAAYVNEDRVKVDRAVTAAGNQAKKATSAVKSYIKHASPTKANPKAKSVSKTQAKAMTVKSTKTKAPTPYLAMDEVFGSVLRKRDEKKSATKCNTVKYRTTK